MFGIRPIDSSQGEPLHHVAVVAPLITFPLPHWRRARNLDPIHLAVLNAFTVLHGATSPQID
jgi:hypothetical protein